MPSPPKTQPDETLLRCHLAYEINMLCETYHLCEEEISKTADSKTKVINNAMIESFCVHARNIIEFLGRPYVSEIYTDKFYEYQRDQNMYSRISSQITHLVYKGTYQRALRDEEKIGLVERAKILNSLAAEIDKFKSKLSTTFSHVEIPVPKHVSVTNQLILEGLATTGSTMTTANQISSSAFYSPLPPKG